MATAPLLDEDEAPANDAGPLSLLAQIAQSQDDISGLLDDQQLSAIGLDVVRDYERDCSDRQEWEDIAKKAVKRAAQEPIDAETRRAAPPYRCSHVNFPILTTAAQQFNARAYPAICQPGNMVKVKVIGSDKGRPQLDEQGQPLALINGQPIPVSQVPQAMAQLQAEVPAAVDGQPAPALPQPQPAWAIPPGAKQKRATRVGEYLNVYLEFRMDNWEEDTDNLLNQIPIIGCGFRKLYWSKGKECAAYVSALDLIVPSGTKSLATTPRITERMNDVFPHQIAERMASGEYRVVDLPPPSDDDDAPRLLLEQHRFIDLDGDGLGEPYIVTADHETSQVLRIVSAFGPDQVHMDGDRVIRIERKTFYVKYGFLPNPDGSFYDIGFGHLLEQIGDVINTTINQMFDAGHAQIAGGGFISGALRLQNNNRNEKMRWGPGEYKVVQAQGGDLRNGIYERTFPGPSQIMFNLLEMMLGAAKDITSVKDIITGDASNQAPVGTTLALIEQGLQVFTAIYKRIYRSLGQEFGVIYDDLSAHGDEEVAEDYMNVLDDPQADFAKDFAENDIDIKPVADPSSVTKMQQMAKAQFMLALRGTGLNDLEIDKYAMEVAGVDDIDRFLPPENAPPNPLAIAELRVKNSQAMLNEANAQKASATATETGVEIGHKLGAADGYSQSGGLSAVAGTSGNAMGAPGGGPDVGPAEGGVDAGLVGSGAV
jgi:chaperonin GroES